MVMPLASAPPCSLWAWITSAFCRSRGSDRTQVLRPHSTGVTLWEVDSYLLLMPDNTTPNLSEQKVPQKLWCAKSCESKCLHHSVTHSLPRAGHPGGHWVALAMMNYKAGHLRPGRRSHSHSGPQGNLSPPAKGSQCLTVRPHPCSVGSLPSRQETIVLFPALTPYPEADSRSNLLSWPLISFNIWRTGNNTFKKRSGEVADHSNDREDNPQGHLPLKFNSFWFIKY